MQKIYFNIIINWIRGLWSLFTYMVNGLIVLNKLKTHPKKAFKRKKNKSFRQKKKKMFLFKQIQRKNWKKLQRNKLINNLFNSVLFWKKSKLRKTTLNTPILSIKNFTKKHPVLVFKSNDLKTPSFLYNLKVFRNFNKFVAYDAIQFYSAYYKPYQVFLKVTTFKKDINLIRSNIFFRIRRTMARLRLNFMIFFHLHYNTYKEMTVFFDTFKGLTPLNYLWFLEHNALFLMLKLKITHTFYLSHFYVRNSYLFASSKKTLDRWTYINYNSVVQVVLNYLVLWKIKHFFTTNKRISIHHKKYFNQIRNKFKKKSNTLTTQVYRYLYTRFMLLKFFEVDYRSLTFIFLPLRYYSLVYNTAYLTWFNYWNHRTVNWKYST